MDELANTFGEDFVQDYKQTIAERREQRNSVSDEHKQEIAHLAVNEGKFQDGDPTFSFTTEEGVEHDVYLMQLPEMEGKSIFGYVSELDSGAVTCPLDYLGDWWSCLFNDPEDLKQMTPGEHYIIIGQYDTWTNDAGETNEQVSPVRGVLSLPDAKKMAKEKLDGEVNDSSSTDDEEDSTGSSSGEDSSEDEDDSSGDSGGFSGFGAGSDDSDDDEEEEDEELLDYEDVADVVEALAQKDDAVWEVDEGDDRFPKLLKVVCNRMELDSEDEQEEAKEKILQRIDEEEEDDEEEGNLF